MGRPLGWLWQQEHPGGLANDRFRDHRRYDWWDHVRRHNWWRVGGRCGMYRQRSVPLGLLRHLWQWQLLRGSMHGRGRLGMQPRWLRQHKWSLHLSRRPFLRSSKLLRPHALSRSLRRHRGLWRFHLGLPQQPPLQHRRHRLLDLLQNELRLRRQFLLQRRHLRAKGGHRGLHGERRLRLRDLRCRRVWVLLRHRLFDD
jgi:hypothetical protein